MTDSALFSMHLISNEADDVLRVFSIDGESEFYTITYKVGSTKRVHEITMSRSQLTEYVADIIVGLNADVIPITSIQFESCITPSIMVHVADLNNYRVVDVIENTLENALMSVKRTL